MFNNITKDDSIDVFYGQGIYVSGADYEHQRTSNCPKELYREFFMADSLCASSLFIKKSLFLKHGLFDKRYKIALDYDRWLCFYMNGAVFKSIPLIVLEFDTNGISSTSLNALVEANRVRASYFTQDEIERFEDKMISQLRYSRLERLLSSKTPVPFSAYKVLSILGCKFKIRRKFLR